MGKKKGEGKKTTRCGGEKGQDGIGGGRRGRGGEMGDALALCVGSLNELVTLQAGLPDPAWILEAPHGWAPANEPEGGGHLSPQAEELKGSSGPGCRPDFKNNPSKMPGFHPRAGKPEPG